MNLFCIFSIANEVNGNLTMVKLEKICRSQKEATDFLLFKKSGVIEKIRTPKGEAEFIVEYGVHEGTLDE